MAALRLNNIMSVSIRYLWSRPGTEALWFKRKVPKDLVSAVGKTWIQFSLGTKDPRQAARLIAMHATDQDKEWSALRAPGTEGLRSQAKRLLESYGVDPSDPKAVPEAAWAFEDFLEDQLPHSVRSDGNITQGHQLDRYLSSVHREALQVLQGRQAFTLADCLAQYIAARPSTEKDARLVFGYLETYLKGPGQCLSGVADLRKVRRDYVNGFVSWLCNGEHGGRKVSTTTVERYLTTLRAAFARAIRENELGIENVFLKVEIKDQGKDAKERETFSVDQYRILHHAIDHWSETKGLDPLRCILTLVSETGARLAEVVGLAAGDVRLEESVPFLRLQENPWRTFKTSGSTRDLPLSPRAVEAARVALDKCGDAAQLFPTYATAKGHKTNSVSAALVNWLRSREGLKGSRLGNHSLRHGMKDRLRAVQCPDSIQDAILGHATPGVGATYGQGYPLPVLAEWMHRALADGDA